MNKYNEEHIREKLLGTWRGNDFALLKYPPRWAERFAGVNDTTRLVLDFKDGDATAVALIAAMAADAIDRQVSYVRDKLGCGYVVVAPTSQAGETNVGCEAVAMVLAARHPFLVHLPEALRRTMSLTPSHLGGDHTVEEQVASMRYAGPALTPDLNSLSCAVCGKHFRIETGFAWHLEHIHHQPLTAVERQLTRDGRTSDPKSAAGKRSLGLNELGVWALRTQRRQQAAEQLRAGPAWRNDDKLIFTTPAGGAMSHRVVWDAFHRRTIRAGVRPIRFHDLRHACATLMLTAGEELAVISKVLGHSDYSTTLRVYAHLDPARARGAATRIDQALARTLPPLEDTVATS